MVPVVGATVSSGFDIVTTLTIANLAEKTFTTEELDLGDGTILPKNADDQDDLGAPSINSQS